MHPRKTMKTSPYPEHNFLSRLSQRIQKQTSFSNFRSIQIPQNLRKMPFVGGKNAFEWMMKLCLASGNHFVKD